MENLGITPNIYPPVRGGTDGSTILPPGLPTELAGGENMHFRFEYVSPNDERAVDVLLRLFG